jgi:formate hydrogenlyase subunit 3/multisubunit Na+/H+ antiporter MnhD subunit
MGFIATLYSRILFSRFRGDFLPNNQSNFFVVVTSICFLLVTICSLRTMGNEGRAVSILDLDTS